MPGCCAWLPSRAAHPDDGPAEHLYERRRAVVPVSLTLGI
eukprot:gene29114-33098_t